MCVVSGPAIICGKEQCCTVRGPREPFLAPKLAGERREVLATIDHFHPAAIVVSTLVIHERHESAIGRYAWIAHVAGGLIEHGANRVLEQVFRALIVNDG